MTMLSKREEVFLQAPLFLAVAASWPQCHFQPIIPKAGFTIGASSGRRSGLLAAMPFSTNYT